MLTLVRGRADRLRNLMRGLARQTLPPRELVIAWMQPEPAPDLPDPGCPVRHLHVPGEPMPLAAARNRAAAAATGDLLVFLDVDCIPGPTLVAAYAEAASAERGLFLGEVLYLPPDAIAGGPAPEPAALDRLGRAHPARPPLPETGLRREPDAGQLWGLSFALPAEAWRAVGGMDERYVGYGGEETDLAARLAGSGLPTFWVAGARAYHQHHPVHVPPLQHFAPILANATRFHARHGRWCMTYWLEQFRAAGLIAWDAEAAAIRVLRQPSAPEIVAALRPQALFS
ncbi:glycosyltransferase family 2 protein [Methylorubrum extorquens]|uniref:glycosyltransferase family 2 protein n=1 Tax=Methylorubrum extorquens TaxID=408 RepID=UPI000306C6A2|nr:galactosyltransferase-related protein [Methylorubrum extorquens]KQP85718.1 sugar transferase [Methylobacterium sp. Leaf119]WIU40005.1 glycosyltransferase [Methylorubrum extorquens]